VVGAEVAVDEVNGAGGVFELVDLGEGLDGGAGDVPDEKRWDAFAAGTPAFEEGAEGHAFDAGLEEERAVGVGADADEDRESRVADEGEGLGFADDGGAASRFVDGARGEALADDKAAFGADEGDVEDAARAYPLHKLGVLRGGVGHGLGSARGRVGAQAQRSASAFGYSG
jgi:hypothetical protein